MDRKTQFKSLCALTLAAAMASFTFFSRNLQPSQSVFLPQTRHNRTLVIDPGHGGEDGGAVSYSGVPESSINLSVALKCDQVAGLFGIPVILLRNTDVSLAAPEAETLREKKRSDLQTRVDIVNGTADAFLLSIHQNQFTDPRYSGAQVFYRPDEPSRLWAVGTQELLRTALAPENDRQAKQIPDEIYLMSHIQCPAILVECGFLSNPEEDRLLQSENYQRRISIVLISSFLSGTGQ